jgi:hypothetical protein
MANGSNIFGDGHAAEHIIRVLEAKLIPLTPARLTAPTAELILMQ